jgi:hypothetical protein
MAWLKKRTVKRGVVWLGLILALAGGLQAEPIATIGVHGWEPDLDQVRAALALNNGGDLQRTQRVQPYVSLRMPLCCIWLDLMYQYYAGEAESRDLALKLHNTGLSGGLILDPFKVILQAGGGVEAVYLSQEGEVASRGRSSHFTRMDWGLNGILGATWEPYPKIGFDLRAVWRWRLEPQIQGVVYDLSGRSLHLGLAYFFR